MKEKLVTVSWSATVSMELPDDATIESLNELTASPNNTTFAERIKSRAFDMIYAYDGEITDIQDDTELFGGWESEEAMNKGIEDFIADRKAKGLWNQPKF